MRRTCTFFMLVSLLFVGCSKSISKNNINIFYDCCLNEDILLNFNESIRDINNFSFYNSDFRGKFIVKSRIADSIIQVEMNDIEISLKDKWVYIACVYNDTRIVIKDELDVFLKELTIILNQEGIECDYNEVREFIYSDIAYFDLSKFKYKGKINSFHVVYKGLVSLYINDNCLIDRLKYKENIIYFDYDKILIDIPLSYDVFPLSVGQVKNFLKIDNLSELFND